MLKCLNDTMDGQLNKNQFRLRIITGIVTILLIVVFGYSWASFKVNPFDITGYLVAQVGSSMGVSMSVSENPFNTLAQQLEEKEAQLQEKEEALEQREASSGSRDFSEEGRIILWLISGLLIILFILILLNFYFDYKRTKYVKVS